MDRELSRRCDRHDDPFDCPDRVIWYSLVHDCYGLIVHDGGSGVYRINYCPWCGARLNEEGAAEAAVDAGRLHMGGPRVTALPAPDAAVAAALKLADTLNDAIVIAHESNDVRITFFDLNAAANFRAAVGDAVPDDN
jgi:hypothetical protein